MKTKEMKANSVNTPITHDPFEQIINVNSKESFFIFLESLQNDFHTNPQEWENTTISTYLESIRNWIEDFSDCPNNDIDWNSLDYATLARISYMGKIYE